MNSHGHWQIIFKYQKKRVYLCSLEDISMAAEVFDLAMLQIKGLQAKTNMNYNQFQILSLLFQPNLIDFCKEITKNKNWVIRQYQNYFQTT